MRVAHYPQARAPAPVRRWQICRSATPALLGLLIAACSSAPPRQAAGPVIRHEGYQSATAYSQRANNVLLRALGLVGTPYRYGGNTPEAGFDCSGLVGFVYRDAAGLKLPRSTAELMELRARHVGRDELQPGDLVLFTPGGSGHVGIYVGEGRFVHAPSTGGTVRMDRLDMSYWARAYAGARRVLD
jgi:cell wall-associated NlpC family hydrolase